MNGGRNDAMRRAVLQRGTETVLELTLERVYPQMYRNYTFVAVNAVGTSTRTIPLVKGMCAVQTKHSCKYLLPLSSSSPVATTTSVILCFNKHRLTQVHLENGR